jgi:hypothetical protein
MIPNDDRCFCSACRSYVQSLESLDIAYCVECGARVRIVLPQRTPTFRSVSSVDSSVDGSTRITAPTRRALHSSR